MTMIKFRKQNVEEEMFNRFNIQKREYELITHLESIPLMKKETFQYFGISNKDGVEYSKWYLISADRLVAYPINAEYYNYMTNPKNYSW